jgi:ABC-type lipoprotein export system ATPase subunit
MVTHDDRYAHVANRIVHLFDGKIVDEERAVAHLPLRAEA